MHEFAKDHPQLVHYTSWEGFRGIFLNRTLWATNIRHLNDQSEYILAKNYLTKSFKEILILAINEKQHEDPKLDKLLLKMGGLEAAAEHNANQMISHLYRAAGDDFYVASFCSISKDDYVAQNGLLSQWRAYGGSTGIAIYFETEKMLRFFSQELKKHSYAASFLDEVVYDDDNQKIKKICAPKVITLFDFAHQIGTGTAQDKIDNKLAADALSAFIYLTTFIKHRGFKEETEIRMVASRNQHEISSTSEEVYDLPQKELKFRSKNSRPLPFIELFHNLNIELPIVRILIGPGEAKHKVAEAIQKFVGNRKIEIAVSDIPFA